jgi:hypothetical protein
VVCSATLKLVSDEGDWGHAGQQQHQNGDADGDRFSSDRGEIVFQAVQHKEIIARLQATDRIERRLQQQHIPFAEHDLTKPFLNGFLAAAQR